MVIVFAIRCLHVRARGSFGNWRMSVHGRSTLGIGKSGLGFKVSFASLGSQQAGCCSTACPWPACTCAKLKMVYMSS